MKNAHAIAEQTYQQLLPSLQQWCGWFALVRGEKLGGLFPTYAAAARAWMALYGPVPALIRRVEQLGVPAAADESNPAQATATPAVPTAQPLDVVMNWALPTGTRNAKRYVA